MGDTTTLIESPSIALANMADRLLLIRSAVTTACEALEGDNLSPRDEHIARLLREFVCHRLDVEIETMSEIRTAVAAPSPAPR